jgi:Fe-Mn family superoxide dismutase
LRAGSDHLDDTFQYKNVRPDYVDRLWSLVNWADVTARFAAAGGA